ICSAANRVSVMIRRQRTHWSPALILTGAMALHESRTSGASPRTTVRALVMTPSGDFKHRKRGATVAAAERVEISAGLRGVPTFRQGAAEICANGRRDLHLRRTRGGSGTPPAAE